MMAVIAGSDTTATSLGNIFWYLLQNKNVYDGLQAEVDLYYPPGEDALDTRHHPKMHYLEAVM